MRNSQWDCLEIDGSRLYYETAGEGEPLVMAHAAFLDSGMWDGQWEPFAQHYRVIRYDMRGFGKSDPLQAPVSRRDELYRLLKHLEANSAHLLGCSLGGEMMLDFTLEHPEMAASLIMVNSAPSGFEMQGEPPAEVIEMIAAMQQGNFERMSELQLRLWIDGPYRQPDEVDPDLRRRAAQMNRIAVQNQTWAIADAQPADPLAPPAVQQLYRVQAPTLVINGALDNAEVLRAGEVMAHSIHGAKKITIEGCAHVPSMEKPEEFNQVVLEFLQGKL